MEKTVLVTGAGRGLGKAISETFAAKGFLVIATDVDPRLLEQYQNRTNFIPFEMDVTNLTSVEEARAQLHDRGIHIDILVNNAGIYDMFPLSESDPQRLRKIMDINLTGSAITIRTFLDDLTEKRGRIIQVSSESVRLPGLFQPYQVSKIAMEAFSISVRQELSLKGVKLVIVRPGAIRTLIYENLTKFTNPSDNSRYEKEFLKFVKETAKNIGRVSEPTEVARVILKAATVNKPKNIYRINNSPWVVFLSLLPARLLELVIRKKFGGH
jgi:NAD(P)-dependent dehydrogenase (short-subunit alcohol dehydrogenase family)